MGDYRQTRNRPVKFVNRPTARFTLRSRAAGSKGRKVALGVPLTLPLIFVAAGLSRAFRDRSGILLFLLSFSHPGQQKRPPVLHHPCRNPIKLSRNEKLNSRCTARSRILRDNPGPGSRAEMQRQTRNHLTRPNRPPHLPNP